MLRSYIIFWFRMIRFAAVGGKGYYLWLLFLMALIVPGAFAYVQQMTEGLSVTHLTDQVSWGSYIANFSFLVGIAATAVLLVVPAYVYHHKPTKDVVLLGELLAVSAILMALLFIVVDLGRPERFIHLLPFLGRINFPGSVLAWDVIVLNGYLLINLHITGYLLFMRYMKKIPNKAIYLPIVVLSILWSGSIHTVGAFLYSGLGGRPFWNTAILAPRFLVAAFIGAPAALTIAFRVIQRFTEFRVDEGVFDLLKKILAISMPINLFLLGCELFTEFYTGTQHVASARYLYFGMEGAHMLRPYIWGSIVLNLSAMMIFLTPKLRDRHGIFFMASVMAILGTWVEKGMGLIIPGFIPSPLGDIVEYTPSQAEFFICLGIWAIGGLAYTILAKVAIGVMTGELKENIK